MNDDAEQGMIAIVLAYAAIAALVDDRATWDDQEIDTVKPSLAFRSLSARFPASHMGGRGGIHQALVEVTARSSMQTGASQLGDLVSLAYEPYEAGPQTVSIENGSITFGAIKLEDVQQAPSVQAQSYRKVLVFSVSFYA